MLSVILGYWVMGGRHRDGDLEGQDLPGAGPVGQPIEVGDVAIGHPPFCGADEQGPPVRTAEHQRERGAVLWQFDALQNFAAFGDAGDREPGADPDRAFGVEADAVRGETAGEDPPVGQAPVGVDVERGERSGERLGDDQRPVIGRDDHAIGELDVAGDLA